MTFKRMGLLAPLLLSGLLWALTGLAGAAAADTPHLVNQDASSLKGVSTPFTFVVIGDNRTGEDVYKKLVGMIAVVSPAFIVNVGDVIYRDASDKEWGRFVSLSSPLKMPYLIAPGNHDVYGKKGEALFKERVQQPGNEMHYSFTAGNALLIVLDSEEPGEEAMITGDQLAWLTDTLKASKEKFRFVFLHRPPYPAGNSIFHTGVRFDKHKAERDALQALFVKYKVGAVFAGHEHIYIRKEVDGITHVITGGGGGPLYSMDEDIGFHHYIKGTVYDNRAEFTVVDMDGKVRDSFTIDKGKNK